MALPFSTSKHAGQPVSEAGDETPGLERRRRPAPLRVAGTSMNSYGGLPRVSVLGLDFVDADDVLELVPPILALADDAWPRDAGRLPVVITPNVDQMVRLDRNDDSVASEIADRAAIVLPDGQPIVWASRLLGHPLSARLPGSTLVDVLWPTIVSERRRALVVSSSEAVTRRVRGESEAVGAITAPVLDLTDTGAFEAFVDECVDRAHAGRSEFVFVTLGFPKQCNVIAQMAARWPDDQPLPVFLAVGASFDMHYGLVPRAPLAIQRIGLEWFFRFLLEPRRLFARYFVRGPAFLVLVAREMRRRRGR